MLNYYNIIKAIHLLSMYLPPKLIPYSMSLILLRFPILLLSSLLSSPLLHLNLSEISFRRYCQTIQCSDDSAVRDSAY